HPDRNPPRKPVRLDLRRADGVRPRVRRPHALLERRLRALRLHPRHAALAEGSPCSELSPARRRRHRDSQPDDLRARLSLGPLATQSNPQASGHLPPFFFPAPALERSIFAPLDFSPLSEPDRPCPNRAARRAPTTRRPSICPTPAFP